MTFNQFSLFMAALLWALVRYPEIGGNFAFGLLFFTATFSCAMRYCLEK